MQFRTADGSVAVHYESDVTTYYDPDTPRNWKYDELRTTVERDAPVEQEAQAWGIPVADPEVEVPVLVPVTHCEGPAIVRKVESTTCREIGESSVPCIEEDRVPLLSAEGTP